MTKSIIKSLLLFCAVWFVSSCDYREYAPAPYPDNCVYQPMALVDGGIWYITEPDTEDAGLPAAGAPVRYYLDESRGKFIINLGVVQSGVSLKPGIVNIRTDASLVNRYILDGTFDPTTVNLPESVYTIPKTVEMTTADATSAFSIEINYNVFLAGEYSGKKFGVAVKIHSDDIKVNSDLSTVVILLDPSYLVL